jgi:hypothetical protein
MSPACPLYVGHCIVCPLLVLYMLSIVLSVLCLSFICWPLCCLSPACPLYVDHCIVCPLLVLYTLTIVLSIPCLSFICWSFCCLSPACPLYVDHCVVCPLFVLYMLTILLSVPCLSFMSWSVCFTCSFNTQFLISPSYFRFKYFFFTICQRLFQQYSSKIVRDNRFYSWRKSEYPGNKRHTARHIDHIKLYRVLFAWFDIKCKALVVIGTDCIGSSTYHAITTTMAHSEILEGRT